MVLSSSSQSSILPNAESKFEVDLPMPKPIRRRASFKLEVTLSSHLRLFVLWAFPSRCSGHDEKNTRSYAIRTSFLHGLSIFITSVHRLNIQRSGFSHRMYGPFLRTQPRRGWWELHGPSNDVAWVFNFSTAIFTNSSEQIRFQ